MKGAIFFSGKYGSTRQYAEWISECTRLPVFVIKDPKAKPTDYDYVVLGSSILYFKLSNYKWIRAVLSLLSSAYSKLSKPNLPYDTKSFKK